MIKIIKRYTKFTTRFSLLSNSNNFSRMHNMMGSILIEVLVSTIIIGMMTTTLFSFVSFAGEIWRKTNSSVNLTNEGNMLMDTIEHELNVALTVTVPTIGTTATTITYTKKISDYQSSPTTATDGIFNIIYTPASRTVRLEITTAPSGWSIATSDGSMQANSYYYNYTLSNHVTVISFKRISKRLMKVSATLSVETADEKIDKKLELERNIIMPSL